MNLGQSFLLPLHMPGSRERDDLHEPDNEGQMWQSIYLQLFSFLFFTSAYHYSNLPLRFVFPPFATQRFSTEGAQKCTMFVSTGALSISVQMDWQPAVSAERAFIPNNGSSPRHAEQWTTTVGETKSQRYICVGNHQETRLVALHTWGDSEPETR